MEEYGQGHYMKQNKNKNTKFIKFYFKDLIRLSALLELFKS